MIGRDIKCGTSTTVWSVTLIVKGTDQAREIVVSRRNMSHVMCQQIGVTPEVTTPEHLAV